MYWKLDFYPTIKMFDSLSPGDVFIPEHDLGGLALEIWRKTELDPASQTNAFRFVGTTASFQFAGNARVLVLREASWILE